MSRYSYSFRKYLPIVLMVVTIIVVVLVLVSVLRAVFFSSDAPKSSESVNTIQSALLDTGSDRAVRLVVRGPIVADENFSSYRITVSPSSRVAQLYSGYLDRLEDEERLDNNTKAYEEFVYALHLANLDKGVQLEGDANDTRGICATGRVYEFSFLKNDETVSTLWTSTCSGSKGSLKANVDQLTGLFNNQVPNSSKITQSLSSTRLSF